MLAAYERLHDDLEPRPGRGDGSEFG